MNTYNYTPRDSKIVSYLMSRVKGKNTKPEIMLRKALWKKGFRYRIHYNIPGRPDIAFTKQNVAIFCDGGFWHGKNFEKTKQELKKNRKFWIEKIKTNINRDKTINKDLHNMGWIVLRFWDDEILHNTERCVSKIKSVLERKS